MNFKIFKLPFIVISSLILIACGTDTDFSGRYALPQNDSCIPEESGNSFITITPTAGSDSVYIARVSPHLTSQGGLPGESSPTAIGDDGNLTFTFYKEGKAAFFSSEPSIEMTMLFEPKDSSHIYLTSWKINMMSSVSSKFNASFDYIKDNELNVMGDKIPNEFGSMISENGLCLTKL